MERARRQQRNIEAFFAQALTETVTACDLRELRHSSVASRDPEHSTGMRTSLLLAVGVLQNDISAASWAATLPPGLDRWQQILPLTTAPFVLLQIQVQVNTPTASDHAAEVVAA
jgi:hypothetical protein